MPTIAPDLNPLAFAAAPAADAWEYSPRPRVLIAGLGNLLLSDDGVGVHACQLLNQEPLGDASILAAEVGTSPLRALHLFEQADWILAVDAVQGGQAPGSIYHWKVESAEEWEANGAPASLHEIGLSRTLAFFQSENRPGIEIYGVEPARIAYGLELTPPVAAALPFLVEKLRAAAWELRGNAQRPAISTC